MKKNKYDEIILFFSSKITITKLEKILNIDQRKIRKIWRDHFGTSKRTIITNQKRIDCENKIYDLIENGYSTTQVSEVLNISKNVVNKYLKLNRPDLLEKLKIKNLKEKSNFMRSFRKKDAIPFDIEESILTHFYSNKSMEYLGKMFNVSLGSIKNIFTKYKGIEEYKERVKKMKVIASKRSLETLDKTKKWGSYPERKFYNLLKDKLNIYVKHHDFDILPPYEIDITIPNLKIAINWNGITHHKPIFGEKYLNKTKSRDIYKIRKLTQMGWNIFTVNDLTIKNDKFIVEQLNKLLELIKQLGYGEVINE